MRISDWSSDVCSSDLYSLASTHAGPISKYRRSVKKLGLRPSNSLLCPTNCAIHATTNTAMAAYSRFHTPKVSYTHRVNQAMATTTPSMPNPSGRAARQSTLHAPNIPSPAPTPALNPEIGTGSPPTTALPTPTTPAPPHTQQG